MRRLIPLQNNQRGDTIVEVLIALAVIGSVLIGAFVVTSRSTTGVRNSEEHAQAMQLLQGQVEQLRAYVQATDKDSIKTYFCFGASPTPTILSNSTPACPSAAVEPIYRFNIQTLSKATPPATSKFQVTVTWNSVTGSPGKEVMYYKVAAK